MEFLGSAVDIIILIGALVLAITNIYKFFANGRKGIKDKIQESRTEQEQAEEERTRATIAKVAEENREVEEKKIREIIKKVEKENAEQRKQEVLDTLEEKAPDYLDAHYKRIREKFRGDRQKYLEDITTEVIDNIHDSLETVETHETRMVIFTEVLKELLRERIMAIYDRNRTRRQLEEHEKIQLDRSYEQYKTIKGNSYIDESYQRMLTWKVIADDYNRQ